MSPKGEIDEAVETTDRGPRQTPAAPARNGLAWVALIVACVGLVLLWRLSGQLIAVGQEVASIESQRPQIDNAIAASERIEPMQTRLNELASASEQAVSEARRAIDDGQSNAQQMAKVHAGSVAAQEQLEQSAARLSDLSDRYDLAQNTLDHGLSEIDRFALELKRVQRERDSATELYAQVMGRAANYALNELSASLSLAKAQFSLGQPTSALAVLDHAVIRLQGHSALEPVMQALIADLKIMRDQGKPDAAEKVRNLAQMAVAINSWSPSAVVARPLRAQAKSGNDDGLPADPNAPEASDLAVSSESESNEVESGAEPATDAVVIAGSGDTDTDTDKAGSALTRNGIATWFQKASTRVSDWVGLESTVDRLGNMVKVTRIPGAPGHETEPANSQTSAEQTSASHSPDTTPSRGQPAGATQAMASKSDSAGQDVGGVVVGQASEASDREPTGANSTGFDVLFLTAQVAVLARDWPTYRRSLRKISALIDARFDASSVDVVQVLTRLNTLEKHSDGASTSSLALTDAAMAAATALADIATLSVDTKETSTGPQQRDAK